MFRCEWSERSEVWEREDFPIVDGKTAVVEVACPVQEFHPEEQHSSSFPVNDLQQATHHLSV